MFDNRKDAGLKLARAVRRFSRSGGIVLAIPRGGVEVGYQVSRQLQWPFSVVIVRKLPFPENPESGFGAMAEDGSVFLQAGYADRIPDDIIERIRREQALEIQRRIRVLRQGRSLPPVAGKNVILVDDGIAMGSTMMAAVRLCRRQKAARIIAAAPVAGPSAMRLLATEADELVVVEHPLHFRAVADAYRHWYDVPDEEVLRFMKGVISNEDGQA